MHHVGVVGVTQSPFLSVCLRLQFDGNNDPSVAMNIPQARSHAGALATTQYNPASEAIMGYKALHARLLVTLS